MKTILQHDERDCGAACLAMVAEHFGYSQSINVFRELTSTDDNGTSIYGILQAAKQIGLLSEALNGSVDELIQGISDSSVKVPFIAHIKTDENYYHYIVISEINNDYLSVLDPARGKYTISKNDFIEKWTGNIVTFEPSPSFQKRKRTKSGLFGFFSLLKKQKRNFFAIILISAIISGIGIMGAFTFQLIIDHSSGIVEMNASHSEHIHEIEYLSDNDLLNDVLGSISNYFEHLDSKSISVIFISMIILYGLAAIIQYVRGELIIKMSKTIDLKLTLPYFNRIIDLPLLTIQRRKTGDYMSRYSDASSIRNAISTATLTLVLDTMMAIGCGIILYFQNKALFPIVMIVIVIYAFIVLANRKRITTSNKLFMEQNASVQSYMKESIDGIETVKAFGAEWSVKKKMLEKFNSFLNSAIKRSRIIISQDALVTGIETIGIAVILWKGFLMVVEGQATLGSLMTFYILLGYFITPIKNLIELQPTMQSAVVAAERLNDILESPVEATEYQERTSIESIDEWSVKNLSFRYGNGDLLLKDVSFSFASGEKVALVGQSGCGKTTLAKLFSRLYSPESGNIFVDNTSLEEYSIKGIRESVSYISNNTRLFSGSVYENIKLGNDYVNESEVRRICEAIGISDMIENLPMQYQFLIEEGGTNLSSGQKQKIVLARAALKQPRLLIMDEATSNMDAESEKDLLRNLFELYPKMSILMISHKISTVKDFDRIIVIDKGIVVGNGKHNDLVKNCKTYSQMVCEQ